MVNDVTFKIIERKYSKQTKKNGFDAEHILECALNNLSSQTKKYQTVKTDANRRNQLDREEGTDCRIRSNPLQYNFRLDLTLAFQTKDNMSNIHTTNLFVVDQYGHRQELKLGVRDSNSTISKKGEFFPEPVVVIGFELPEGAYGKLRKNCELDEFFEKNIIKILDASMVCLVEYLKDHPEYVRKPKDIDKPEVYDPDKSIIREKVDIYTIDPYHPMSAETHLNL